MKIGAEKILNAISASNNINWVYLVMYNDVFYRPDAKITSKETHVLHAFEDRDEAIKYANLAHEIIVGPNLTSGYFKLLFAQNPEDVIPDLDGITVWKRNTKLIGNDDYHKCQTKFFSFYINLVRLKPKE